MQYRTIRFASTPQGEDDHPRPPDDLILSDSEVRVLGSLLEKETTTPDYYPLRLSALVSACNQKTSRVPVVSYSEAAVQQTLEALQEKNLVRRVLTSEGRVPRYRHIFSDAFRLNRAQSAALCVLMLRGPQTAGEIRQRSSRLYDFASLAEVEETLDSLTAREPRPLVQRLPLQAGTKEARYSHLLSGEIRAPEPENVAVSEAQGEESGDLKERVSRLEGEVDALRQEIHELQQQLDAFRRQFE